MEQNLHEHERVSEPRRRASDRLQKFLDVSKEDREITLDVVRGLRDAVKDTRECSAYMRIQIERLKTSAKLFTNSCSERRESCAKRLDVAALKEGLESISDELRDLKIKVYVLVGVCIGVFAVVRWILPLYHSLAKSRGG